MKKSIWIISFILLANICNCQEIILRTSTGINLSKQTGDDSFKKTNSFLMAPFLSFEVDKPLNNYFSINLGLEYSVKGTNYDEITPLGNIDSYIHYFGYRKFHYLIVPIGVNCNVKNLFLTYKLYTGKKMVGYAQSLAETFENGESVSQTISSGKIFKSAYDNPLFGHEIGIGYKINNDVIKISYIKDLITIDNLNSTFMYHSCIRLSYCLTLNKPNSN